VLIISLLAAAALVCAVLCIRYDYAGRRRLVYFFKPAATILIITLAVLLAQHAPPAYRTWIIAGLCFSLVGDIMLMLPRDRFLAGLGAFLVAHWCYITAFASLPSDPNFYVLPLWLGFGIGVFYFIKPKKKVIRAAVFVYVISIVTMTWLAVENWRLAGLALAGVGALLFLTSDTLIGLRRFRGNWHSGQALTLGTYFPAQLLIAGSLGAVSATSAI